MKKLLALLLLFGIVGCNTTPTPIMEYGLYAYSEKQQKKVSVDEWATDFCSDYIAEKFNQDMGLNFLLNCKYALVRFAQEENSKGSTKFISGTSGTDQEFEPKLYSNNPRGGFLVEVLKRAIIAYPEAKAKAEREAAIRRNAYIKGQNDARASCRGSISC